MMKKEKRIQLLNLIIRNNGYCVPFYEIDCTKKDCPIFLKCFCKKVNQKYSSRARVAKKELSKYSKGDIMEALI